MKMCKRGLDYIQVYDNRGFVRSCPWMCDNSSVFGSVLTQNWDEILNSKNAQNFKASLLDGSYKYCKKDDCPYLSNGRMDEMLIDVNEKDISNYFPTTLHIAYEENCNYRCTCCDNFNVLTYASTHDCSKRYDIIENKVREILPHIKHIGAHGTAELFCSPRIMNMLNEWASITPPL